MADDNPYAKYGGGTGGQSDNPYAKYGGGVEQSSPAPEPRTDRAFQRGFASSASFGFLDEIEGLAKAGGLDANDPDVWNALSSIVVGSYRKLKGDPEAQKAYDEQVGKSRELSKGLEEQHPTATMAGGLGGAVALPFAAAARLPKAAAGLTGKALAEAQRLARVRASAITGGVTGALSGVGGGEDTATRVGGGVIGGTVGSTIGAVAPTVIEPIAKAGAQVLRPITNRIAGLRNPKEEAMRRIGLAGSAAKPSQALSEAEYAAAQNAGTPVSVVDRLGVPGQSLARSAANTSTVARADLEDVAARSVNEGGRLALWLKGQFHHDAADLQDAITAAARTANPAGYRKAAQEAAQLHPGGLWDEGFEQIAQAPEVQAAIRKASVTGASRAAKEGFTPIGNPFKMDRQTGRMTLPDGAPRPNLEFWDQVKKNLDTLGTREAKDWSRVLRERIDELVPAYGEARAGAAAFFGAKDMVEAGQKAVNSAGKFELPEMRRVLAKASPEEQKLFNDGYASRMIETLNASPTQRATMLNRIRGSEAAREELALGLGGKAKAEEFQARMRVEGIMKNLNKALNGTTTARQLAELGLAGGAGAVDYLAVGSDAYHAGATGAAVYGLLRTGGRLAGQKIDQRVVEHVAQLLTSADQSVVERGIKLAATNPSLMRALENADNRVARVVGSSAPKNIPGMQAGAPGRADENQPQVPGPPQ